MAGLVEVPCKPCKGTGSLERRGPQLNAGMYEPCPFCHGSGSTLQQGAGCIASTIMWIILGFLVIAIVGGVALRALGIIGAPETNVLPEANAPVEAGGYSVGDCVANAKATPQIVACDQTHDLEVYGLARVDLPTGEAFPGDDVLHAFADRACEAAFEEYVGSDIRSTSLARNSFTPNAEGWAKGKRDVACTVSEHKLSELAPVAGSLRGSKR
ncbi:MAG: septum formation family protein [Acidimicrobiales bacterium]|nr:septum formation family protein [Acidimicrobiales bacterium]